MNAITHRMNKIALKISSVNGTMGSKPSLGSQKKLFADVGTAMASLDPWKVGQLPRLSSRLKVSQCMLK